MLELIDYSQVRLCGRNNGPTIDTISLDLLFLFPERMLAPLADALDHVGIRPTKQTKTI